MKGIPFSRKDWKEIGENFFWALAVLGILILMTGVPVSAATAEFSFNESTGCRPFNIQFTDESTCSPSPCAWWNWSFGDGSTNSTEQNPLHTYTEFYGNGWGTTYTVTLCVNDGATDCETKSSALSASTNLYHIDDSAELLFGERNLVRDSLGQLWAASIDDTQDYINLSYSADEGQTWITVPVVHQAGASFYEVETTVNSEDDVEIVFYNFGSATYSLTLYADTYTFSDIALITAGGGNLATAIDSDDTLHLVIGTGSSYVYTYRTLGGTWQALQTINTTDGSGDPSLTIDSNNLLHLIGKTETFFPAAKIVEYFTSYGHGAAWSTGYNLGATFGTISSITADGDDNIHVAFGDGSTIKYREKYADNSSWGSVVTINTEAESERYPTISADAEGSVYITYYGATSTNSYVIKKYSNGTWDSDARTVDTGGYGHGLRSSYWPRIDNISSNLPTRGFAFLHVNSSKNFNYYGSCDVLFPRVFLDPTINGTVYDAFTGDVIENANLSFNQGGTLHNETTNASGFYSHDGFATDIPILMVANKSGYYNETYTFTPTAETSYIIDWYLIPDLDYPIMGIVYDVTDHSAISGAIVHLEGITQTYEDYFTTSSTGFFYFEGMPDENYTYKVTATKPGYYDKVVQFNTSTEDYTIVYVPMYPGITGTEGGAGYAYPPHNVKYVLRDLFSGPIAGATCACQGYETTAGAWDWFTSLLGMPLDEAPIHNASMTGTTGSDGSIDFMMLEAVHYNCTFTSSSGNATWSGYPKDDYYEIWVVGTNEWFEGGESELEEVNITISETAINTTAANISVRYIDNMSDTTGGTIHLNQTNKTATDLPQVEIDDYSIASSNFTAYFVVTGKQGECYFVNVDAAHTTFGSVNRTYSVCFKEAPVTMGLPSEWMLYVAMFLIMFTGMFFGATTAPTMGALISSFMGWICYFVGWLDSLDPTVSLSALTFATFISILSIVMVRSKKERYV